MGLDHGRIIETNAFCAVIMGIILYSLFKNYDRQTKQRYYIKAVIAGLISFICEINWALIESGVLNEPRILNFLTNGCYDIVTVFTGYFWFCFVEVSLDCPNIRKKTFRWFAKIPVFIIIAMVIGSYFKGWLFYIDKNNYYNRGSLVIVHVIMCHLYTLATTIHALVKSFQSKVYIKTAEYRILAMFLLFPLVLGILQILEPNIPSISIGITLAFLYEYVDLQNLLISVDTLSGLNNRNQLLRYLGSRMKSESEKDKLYVFMLDVNKFKKINDTFGHVEGDMALIRCANALKVANKDTNNFIGRYGGDEFIIIAELDNEEEAKEICKRVNFALADICGKDNVSYDLSFSIGYMPYDTRMLSIQSFIAAADKKLYEAKKAREITARENSSLAT